MRVARACLALAVLSWARAVEDPELVAANIAGAEGATVTGELGQPLAVRCHAYGHPPPAVSWHRSHGGDGPKILSDALYEMRGSELQIRHLTIESLGQYECRATNSVDRTATWHVVIRAYRPHSPYLVDTEVLQTTPVPASAVPTTNTLQPDLTTLLHYAQGVELDGFVKSCNTSAFGYCPDGETPAHGAGNEGCCLLYPYGCCPNNFKPADGPYLEGCGCQYSRYGCCPDNVTVATGSDNKGCGCQYSEYGCCPDRRSEASGLEFEGCMCHTYQFGCCPDGVTIAQGPNGQGCYCQQSQFGCCGDDQTHAKRPDRQGCDCATSKHGCCLDGTTEATGPKFEGCIDKPLDKQAACSLRFERGPCQNYSVRWFYDTEYGGCSRFWYGGCEGNGNRFGTKEECEDTCVSPPARDVCRLPPIKGLCLKDNERWYYDTEREKCSKFLYGGCLGNDNNFESRELCQARCEPERSTEQCSLTIERGSCAGNYLRWGYKKDTRSCEEFLWGGCEGNSNRFSTEAACMLRCHPPGEPQPECSKAQDVGNGTDVEARWSFSQTENRCVPFYYTGSGGNGNKYTTREECQEACPSAFVPELCTLPATTGECNDYRAKYYFDTKYQKCRIFYYGGCGGNENRFDTEQDCTNRCSPPSTTPAPRVSTTPPQPASGSAHVAAGIAGADNATITGEMGQPVIVRCHAYGYPAPVLYWFRDGPRGLILPSKSELYYSHGLQLLIRRLTPETLGEYVCQADNGEGNPAVWHFVVRAYLPTPSPYQAERSNGETLPTVSASPAPPATTLEEDTSTTQSSELLH